MFQGFPPQQCSGFEPQTTGPAYPSTLLRVASAPSLYPQGRMAQNQYSAQGAITHHPEIRRNSSNSLATPFDTHQSFQDIPSYQTHAQQDSNSLPAVQATFSRQFLDPGHASSYYEHRGFIETVSTAADHIDPHVLHQVPASDRHHSWDASSGGASYNTSWTPRERTGQNYGQQISYESSSHGFKDDYQFSGVSEALGHVLFVSFTFNCGINTMASYQSPNSEQAQQGSSNP